MVNYHSQPRLIAKPRGQYETSISFETVDINVQIVHNFMAKVTSPRLTDYLKLVTNTDGRMEDANGDVATRKYVFLLFSLSLKYVTIFPRRATSSQYGYTLALLWPG